MNRSQLLALSCCVVVLHSTPAFPAGESAPTPQPTETPATTQTAKPPPTGAGATQATKPASARDASQADQEAQPIAELASTVGKVHVLRGGDRVAVKKGAQLFASDQLVTSANSVAKIVFADGSNFIVMQEASVEIEDYWTEAKGKKTTLKSALNVVRGKARFFFKPREGGIEATVKTSNTVMGIRGTVLFVDHQPKDESTNIVVVDGIVAVTNVLKPLQEVLLHAKETTSVNAEAAPEKPKVAPPEVINTLVAQAQAVPDAYPDGQAPETLALPPPRAPDEKKEEKSNGGIQLPYPQGVVREIVTPQFMVVPMGANMVSRSQIRCDRASLDKLREAASQFDDEAVLFGRELAQCPGMADEAIFWLGFFHRAAGESSRAIEASGLATQEKIPLDVRTDREIAIQAAIEGRTLDLQKYLRSKKGKDRDLEAVLVLARTYARLGNFKDSESLYKEYIAAPKLGTNVPAQIELGYLLLLENEFEKAEAHFLALTSESLPVAAERTVLRGLEIAYARQQRPTGAEDDDVKLYFSNFSTEDELEITGLRAEWNSRTLLADLFFGSMKYDPGDISPELKEIVEKTRYDLRYVHPRVGKEFTFSSGTKLRALVGFAPIGGRDNFSLNTDASQEFKRGYSIFGSFNRNPYGIEELATLEQIDDKAAKTTIIFGGSYGRLFANRKYLTVSTRIDQITDDSNSDQLITAGARINAPIHKGASLRDYLFATGRIEWQKGSNQDAQFYSPERSITVGVGAEFSKPFKLWRNFVASLPAEFLIVSRSASEKPESKSSGSSNSSTPKPFEPDDMSSKLRQYIENETGFDITPRLEVEVVRNVDAFVQVHNIQFTDSAEGKASWRQTQVSIGVSWNYGRSAPTL